MENEKKIKLAELPNEGSELEVKVKPLIRPKLEPRVENLRKLDAAGKLENISLRWHFDIPQRHWGWLWTILILFVLQKSGILANLLNKNIESNDETLAYLGQSLLRSFDIDYLITHPMAFSLLVPVFYKFKSSSLFYFEITFDGIESVRKIDFDKNEGCQRVKMKWPDIIQVQKGMTNGREVLVVSNQSHETVELIWDIDDVKKKVIKRVLRGLLSPKHPFRTFIEKEVA